MNKDYFYIVLFSILLYIPLFLRNSLTPFFDGDSYYYLNSIFINSSLHLDNAFNILFFNLFPQNILFIKIIMFLFTVVCGIIMYRIIGLFNIRNRLFGVGLFYSLIWFNWIFLKFENDLFGFTFILLSLYFLLKYRTKRYDKRIFNFYIIASLVFLFIGCVGFWGFGIFYIYLFLVISGFHILYIFGCLSTIYFFPRLISRLLPNFLVAENQIIVGGIVLLFLFFLYIKENRIDFIWTPIIISSFFALINLKFIYVVIPLLLINISKVNFYNYNRKIFVICIILFGLITTTYQSFFVFPTYTDYELFRVAKSSLTCNEKIYYSWSTGYIVKFWGTDTTHFGTPPKNQEMYYDGCVYTLLNDPIARKKCDLVEQSRPDFFGEYNSAIYFCGSA